MLREREPFENPNMNSADKILRWLNIALLGCALGLLFVAADLALLSYLRHAGYISGPAEPGFRLSDEPVKRELTRVISSQLAAFRKGDYAGAYDFAATGLKTRLSPAAFERMVRDGYPVITHSSAANFGLILDNGDHAVVTVGVRDATGRMSHYQYLLMREPDGWKISGVTRITLRGTTV